jgi:hypothetical protein
MKKTILIVAAIVLIITGAVAIYFFFRSTTGAPPPQDGGTVFPGSGTVDGGTGSTPQRTVQTYDHHPLATADFTKASGVITDPNVPGQYDLAGGANADASTPYQIFYQSTDDYFGITLYHEPLGQTRRDAEQKLMNMLGITQEQMCTLSYVVAPGPGVNDSYAGENLGFSFCPGAVALP